MLSFVVLGASGCASHSVEVTPPREVRSKPLPTVTSPLIRSATERLGREMEADKPQRMIRDPAAPMAVDLDDLNVVGADSESVPEFELVLSDESVVRSRDLVGQKPFVIAFFATWCQVCEIKLPLVKAALDKAGGDVRLLLVSVDEPDTWRHVPGYLREQHFADEPVASAFENPRFTMGYDPMGAVPLVVVVDRAGRLVDYQIGLTGNDGPRLVDAVARAVTGGLSATDATARSFGKWRYDDVPR